MALNVGKLQADIELDISGFQRDIQRAGQEFRGLGDSADTASTSARQSLARIGDAASQSARQGAEDFDTQMQRIRQSADQSGRQAGQGFRDGFGNGTSGLGDGITDQLNQGAGGAGAAGEEGGDGFSGGFMAVVGKLGGKGGPIAAALLAGVAVAGTIGAKYADAIMEGFDIQAERGFTKATFGFTDTQMATVGKAAGNAFGNAWGESVDENMRAAGVAMQAGILDGNATADQIQPVVEKLNIVSQIMGEEIPAVARAAGQMIKTGMADNATQAMDVIVAAQQKGLNLSEDLLDTLNEYGTQWRKVGIDGVDALGLVAQATQNGARDSDVAADAIKEFAIRAVDGSEATVGAFEALGLNADEMSEKFGKGGATARAGLDQILDGIREIEDPVERGQVAAALFGTQWEDLGDAFSHFDLSTARGELGDFAGAADRAGDAMSGGASSIQAAKNKITVAADEMKLKLGEAFAPAASDLADWVTENQDEILEFFTTIVGGGLQLGIAMGNVTAGILHSWAAMTRALAPIVGGIMDMFGTAWEYIGKGISLIPGMDSVGNAIESAGKMAQGAGEGMASMADAADGAADFIADGLVPAMANAKNGLEGMGGSAELSAAQVESLIGKVNELPRNTSVNVDAPGGEEVYDLLTNMGAAVKTDNNKNIVVEAPLAQNVLDLLESLGISVRTDNDKQILVTDNGTAAATQQNIKDIQGKTVRVNVEGNFIGQLGQLMQGQTPTSSQIPLNNGTSSGGSIHIPSNATGGPIVGPGTGTSDDVLMWGSNGEYVQTAAATDYYGVGFMDAINSRSIPKSMLPAYADGGLVGTYGLPAGSSVSYGGTGFPDWVTQLGSQYGVQPSTYPGHQESDRGEAGYAPNPQHLNRGIDWSGPVNSMQSFAEYLAQIAPSLATLEQIIWQNPSTGQQIGWYGRTRDTGSYFAGDYGGHTDHVHTRQNGPIGGVSLSGLTLTPMGVQEITLTADSSREDVAKKIIAEGRKRGYSDAQIADILAMSIQESNLSPSASGGGGAWLGVFQQDSSYSGRNDPNTQITGFYDTLDAKRNSDGWSDNMDENIFWVQQRPGESSAKAAVANGRAGYMDEINSRQAEADALVAQLGPQVSTVTTTTTPAEGDGDDDDDTKTTSTKPEDPSIFEYTIDNPFEPFWWKGEKQYRDRIISDYEKQKAWDEYISGTSKDSAENAADVAKENADLAQKVTDAKRKVQEADDALKIAEQRKRELKDDAKQSERMSAESAITKATNSAAQAREDLAEAEKALAEAQQKSAATSQDSDADATKLQAGQIDSPAMKRASGGPVSGAGGPRDDLVPIMASNGEYVQQASAVDYYGRAFMDAVNAKRLPRTLFRADGGFAGYTDDDTDVMAPNNWYDWAAMGVGAGFSAYNTIDPYLQMAVSGNVDLGNATPRISTNSTDTAYPSSIISNFGNQISSQLAELIWAVKEGKDIKITVNSPNAPQGGFNEAALAAAKTGF